MGAQRRLRMHASSHTANIQARWDLPLTRMSLSMLFGTPTTAHAYFCRSHSSAMECAAALPPACRGLKAAFPTPLQNFQRGKCTLSWHPLVHHSTAAAAAAAATRCTALETPCRPTVAADDKEHVDAPQPQPLHNLRDLGVAARGALRSAAQRSVRFRAAAYQGDGVVGLKGPPALRCQALCLRPAPLCPPLPQTNYHPPFTSTVPPLSWMPSTHCLVSCTGLACRSRKPRSPYRMPKICGRSQAKSGF